MFCFRLSSYLRFLLVSVLLSALVIPAQAQNSASNSELEQLRQTVLALEARVAALEQERAQSHGTSAIATSDSPQPAVVLASATAELRQPEGAPLPAAAVVQSSPTAPLPSPFPTTLPGGATLSYTIDGYYEYNFNHPVGGVNLLRAYDVTSSSFNINQAAVIFDLQPDVPAGRRFGARLDLQFGQATSTLQGNPANEARPDVWRNIFQAYGTYVVPVGSGLTVDFGKWASSLGIEGNYTKDQMNYSRSYYFNYLPYYHMGFRTNYKFNDKIAASYWLVNGTQQTEDVNGFKDQLFGLQLQPAKTVSWTINYYFGQEHPDTTPSTSCTEPLQPGLCATPINPAPNGKLHIFDTYATWQALPKLTLAGEGDYVIEREWANAAPGESSAPSHVDGGAAYALWQFTPRIALAARSEYLSDRGGLFSNETQALKEVTGTYQYKFGDGFEAFLEYRRDWSNQPYFWTDQTGVLSGDQNTTTMGLVWWSGGKQGSW
jgi:hypothetical protein